MKIQRLVTVIIPVYDVEKYIEKCIYSLLNQIYKNFEVLIVNDGTKDNSIQLAKSIVKDDIRFIFLEKENGGLSDARNFGIKKAKGEYLTFLDSDDYYDAYFLEKMVAKIEKENSDIIICDIELVNEKYESLRKQKNIHSNPVKGKDAILDITILNMAQNKLYKKELFNDIFYPKGYYYEDRATTYKLFYKAKKISFINDILFYYLQRNNSITRGLNQQKLTDPLKILDEIKSFLIEKNIFVTYREKYIQNYLLAVLSSSVQIANFSEDYNKDIKNYLQLVDKKYFNFNNFLFLYSNYPKKSLALFLLKINRKLFKILSIKEKKL